MSRKITIEPVTRVEGHGKITIKLDDADRVIQTRLHIVEFRGFERFVQGRFYWEAPVLVQRLCGICPVSHHLAASKAMDHVIGVPSDQITGTADRMRRLMHYGQIFQSHVVHFFYLACPDLLFGVNLGIGSDPKTRNIAGVIEAFPEIAKKAVLMRKFGQEVVRLTAGKRIHGTGSVPGGINKHLTREEGDSLLKGTPEFNAETMVSWASEGLALFKDYHRKNLEFIDRFAAFPSNYMSLVREDGAMDLYHGVLRAIDHEGQKIFDQVDYQEYADHIAEEVETWTYMKFPYFRALGREKGWYRVGPLARLNTCDFITTPLAQKEFEEYRTYFHGKITHSTMHTHWARLIEALHAAEVIRDLLKDPNLYSGELVKSGRHVGKGVGVIEAPRGTLFHQYSVNDEDLITKCTLLVSTTSNNEGMNRSVGWVADQMISGKRDIPEGVLNQVEVALRAYDPCLSCATHAVGQMPLELILFDSQDQVLARATKNADTGVLI